MKVDRVSLALWILAPALVRCEPVDEAPPPAAPQGMNEGPPGAPPPPPGPPPSSAPSPSPASADGEPAYASPEYTIGEDTDSYDDNDPSALKDFHAALDPNGTWADDSTYGTVWVPSTAAVGADFTPYATAGHWLYDTDWVWASDYPWGWAPFHYGRWVRIEGRGWAWIPGRAYRGAWVTWGVNDGYTYLGWAPLGPSFVWFGGMAIGWGGYIGPSWVYCPRGEVFSPGVGARVVTGAAAGPIAAGMHGYVTATPGVSGGPSPQRLGYNASQVPRPTGSAAAGVAHAQAFARPSTGQALGASNPSHVATPEANRAALSHATPATARPSITGMSRPAEGSAHAAAPSVAHSSVSPQGAAAAHTAAVPAARSSGWHGATGGGGGGHHR
ncbi:MAG: DUF6600 domain-containing protein [Polyangiaceae bacterium]|jgi:hypothetical protein